MFQRLGLATQAAAIVTSNPKLTNGTTTLEFYDLVLATNTGLLANGVDRSEAS